MITIPRAFVVDVAQPLKGLEGLVGVTFKCRAILMFAEGVRQRGKAGGRSIRVNESEAKGAR
jgi:hypothetical protein